MVGYAGVGSAPGYGGPIEMLVGVDANGVILGTMIVAQRESPGFFRLVENSDLITGLAERSVTEPLQLGDDLDAVTGATVSAEGVASAVRLAVRDIAAEKLNTPLPPEKRSLQVGWPELILLLLFASGYVGHKLRGGVWKQRVRWGNPARRDGVHRLCLHRPPDHYHGYLAAEWLLARLAQQPVLVSAHRRHLIRHHRRREKSLLQLVLPVRGVPGMPGGGLPCQTLSAPGVKYAAQMGATGVGVRSHCAGAGNSGGQGWQL